MVRETVNKYNTALLIQINTNKILQLLYLYGMILKVEINYCHMYSCCQLMSVNDLYLLRCLLDEFKCHFTIVDKC